MASEIIDVDAQDKETAVKTGDEHPLDHVGTEKIANTAEVEAAIKIRNADTEQASEPKKEKPPELDQKKNSYAAAEPYVIPTWSGVSSAKFSLDVLKDGCIIQQLDVSKKGAYMFGRSDRCDFILEHPSISRYHAVLQFRADSAIFIFDIGSTHGCFVNKQRVKPRVHVPLRVGDILKFGLSTRLYSLQGPPELMPEEGLSRAERHALRLREAAIHAGGAPSNKNSSSTVEQGISWGMGEDAEDEEDEEEGDVDREQLFSGLGGKLTESQQKLLDKINKKKEKVSHMETEIKAIEAKEMAQGGLREGQQNQIERNKQRINTLNEEIDDLSETLEDSVNTSVASRARTKAKGGSKKAGDAAGDPDEAGLSDEDEFYDRVGRGKKKAAVSSTTSEPVGEQVETMESLLAKKEALEKELEEVRSTMDAEAGGAGGGQGGGADDPLDQFMDSVASQMVEERRRSKRASMDRLAGEINRVQRLLLVADPSGEHASRLAFRQAQALTAAQQKSEEKQGTVDSKEKKVEVKTEAGLVAKPDPEMQVVSESKSVPEPVGDGRSGADKSSLVAVAGAVEGSEQEERDSAEIASVSEVEQSQERDSKDKEGSLASKDEAAVGKRKKTAAGAAKAKRKRMGPERPPPQFLDEAEVGEVDVWVPPQGQSGDGRLSLNDKLGY